jgi:hypothetical protein
MKKQCIEKSIDFSKLWVKLFNLLGWTFFNEKWKCIGKINYILKLIYGRSYYP